MYSLCFVNHPCPLNSSIDAAIPILSPQIIAMPSSCPHLRPIHFNLAPPLEFTELSDVHCVLFNYRGRQNMF